MNSASPDRLKPKRRWLRFSLRTLLLLMLVIGLVASWIGSEVRSVLRQREVAKRIRAMGGGVAWLHEFQSDSESSLTKLKRRMIQRIFGDDLLANAAGVTIELKPEVNDTELVWLSELPHLTVVRLDSSQVSEAGMIELARVPKLTTLILYYTRVSSDGLAQLASAKNLTELSLYGTEISDDTLKRLDELQNLTEVTIGGTHVTSLGLAPLSRLQRLTRLDFYAMFVIDESELGETARLEYSVVGEYVAQHGLEELRRTLPICRVRYFVHGKIDEFGQE